MSLPRKKPWWRHPGTDRFWQRVNHNGPMHPVLETRCWLWIAYTFSDGYGGIRVEHKWYRAHRYSWILHNGAIPSGIKVLHHCDTPLCVNPEHLFLGTTLDNSLDCVKKSRHTHGETHGSAKLTETNVRQIKCLYKFGKRGSGSTALARKFGVSKPVILGIIKGTGWKHVK